MIRTTLSSKLLVACSNNSSLLPIALDAHDTLLVRHMVWLGSVIKTYYDNIEMPLFGSWHPSFIGLVLWIQLPDAIGQVALQGFARKPSLGETFDFLLPCFRLHDPESTKIGKKCISVQLHLLLM